VLYKHKFAVYMELLPAYQKGGHLQLVADRRLAIDMLLFICILISNYVSTFENIGGYSK